MDLFSSSLHWLRIEFTAADSGKLDPVEKECRILFAKVFNNSFQALGVRLKNGLISIVNNEGYRTCRSKGMTCFTEARSGGSLD